jgi:hypothetical protein
MLRGEIVSRPDDIKRTDRGEPHGGERGHRNSLADGLGLPGGSRLWRLGLGGHKGAGQGQRSQDE